MLTPVQREQFSVWKSLRTALYHELDESFHDAEMEWIFASGDKQCWLLQAGGAAIGLLEVSLRNVVDGCIGDAVGYVEGIYLTPEHRGQGHGRRMLAHAEAWFRERGCRDMATDAELDNVAAQEFFRRTGFVEGWRIVEYRKPLAPGP